MRNVFDQHTEMDDNGDVTGGNGKLLCLRDSEISKSVVRRLVKTPYRNIIEELRALFRDLYLFAPNLSEDSDSDGSSTDEDDLRAQKSTHVREATKKLSSSKWMLEMISRHLSSKWDVDDDGNLHKTVLRPDWAASRSRCNREAEDSSEEESASTTTSY